MKVVDRLSQKILHLAPVPESNTSLPSDDDENYDCGRTVMGLPSSSAESIFGDHYFYTAVSVLTHAHKLATLAEMILC